VHSVVNTKSEYAGPFGAGCTTGSGEVS